MSPIHKGRTYLASAHYFDRFALPQPIVRFGLSFANEKLQALFTKTVFEETLKAYAADGIEAAEITFVDGGKIATLITNSLWSSCHSPCNHLPSVWRFPCFSSVFAILSLRYVDNKHLLAIFDMPNTGLWPLLSEECMVPKGSDKGFCEKVSRLRPKLAHLRGGRTR